jgi:hypothetical protein
VRLLALLAVRDEMAHLPGLLANVGPHVDGIVALDDGSSDGSGSWLEAREEVLEVLRPAAPRDGWDEPGNHRLLVEAGLRHGADWLLAIDADERVERAFRDRAERVIARGRPFGFKAYALHFRELWDDPGAMRVDGIWGVKAFARLFRALPDHVFDERPLHAHKAPMQAKVAGRYPHADLFVYHLGMLERSDRLARRARYEQLDPEERWQQDVGYAYLTDETGLQTVPLPRGRGWSA